MDVYEYFESKERECRELSLVPDGEFSEMFAEEAGSDGARGIVFGRLVLDDHSFLSVFESVEVQGSGIHREEYSYYLIRDGIEMWGYDRDPSHNPAEHMHRGVDHTRLSSGRVTFKEVGERAWETCAHEDSLADTEVEG